jgi:hypothetical protein
VRARVLARRRDHQYWPAWLSVLCLAVALLFLITAAGCRPGTPVSDTGPRQAEAQGTITGTVRSQEGIDGRPVEVVNLDTNERQRVTTNGAGGFTFKVRPGKYRVELTLRQGETIVKQPGVMHVNRSDVDAHADFVLSSGGASDRSSRPRSPASRLDPGLGSPMA